jgi:hypothetical protein
MKMLFRTLAYTCFILPLVTVYFILFPNWDILEATKRADYSTNFIIIVVVLAIVIIVLRFIDAEFKDAQRTARLIWRASKTIVVLFILWQGSDALGVILLDMAQYINNKLETTTQFLEQVSFTFILVLMEVATGYVLLITESFKTNKKKGH